MIDKIEKEAKETKEAKENKEKILRNIGIKPVIPKKSDIQNTVKENALSAVNPVVGLTTKYNACSLPVIFESTPVKVEIPDCATKLWYFTSLKR